MIEQLEKLLDSKEGENLEFKEAKTKRESKIPEHLKKRLQSLVEMGIVERFGRGRGVKYVLSRRYYTMAGEKGTYTRKKGLDRETNKALLLKHIKENRKTGSRLKELMQVLPALSKDQVQQGHHYGIRKTEILLRSQ